MRICANDVRRIRTGVCRVPAITPALLVALMVGGCKSRHPAGSTPTTGSPPSSAPAPDTTLTPSGPVTYGPGPRPIDPHTLSDAELRYGVSPTKSDAVTYQDNVVLMEHGAQAIHSESPDGTTWTLDASAPQVADLQPGKIMFASSRPVGRVLAVSRTGSEVSVVIGPVELTDVIRRRTSRTTSQSISSRWSPTGAELSGTTNEMDKLTGDARRGDSTSVTTVVLSPSGGITPVAFASNHGETRRAPESWTDGDAARFRALQQEPSLPSVPGIGPPGETSLGDFHVFPFCCGGLGIKLVHNGDDINMIAYAVLRFSKPSLQFNLKIHGGSVQTAKVVLNGAFWPHGPHRGRDPEGSRGQHQQDVLHAGRSQHSDRGHGRAIRRDAASAVADPDGLHGQELHAEHVGRLLVQRYHLHGVRQWWLGARRADRSSIPTATSGSLSAACRSA